MIAIETRYLGPTNYRGSRYVATTANDHRVVLDSDHSLNDAENHARAAQALADKYDWHWELQGGYTKAGMCWVFVKTDAYSNPYRIREREQVTR